MINKKNNELYRMLKNECKYFDKNHYQWVKLLTKDKKEEYEKFKEYLIESQRVILEAIFDYSDHLRKQGRGVVSVIELQESYENNDLNKFKELIQELFLEYVNNAYFTYIIETIEKKNIGIEKICELHNKYPETRIIPLLKKC